MKINSPRVLRVVPYYALLGLVLLKTSLGTLKGMNQIDTVYANAATALPLFTLVVETAAAAVTGGRPVVAPLKGKARAAEKAAECGWENLTDIVRATVVVRSRRDFDAVLASVAGQVEVVRVKDRRDSTCRDILMVVRVAGVCCEIQVHVATVFAVKAWPGHKMYEVERSTKSALVRAACARAGAVLYAAAWAVS